MKLARSGRLDVAAACELALLGIAHPTPEQIAGATNRAQARDDLRFIRSAYEE